jgi:hypothetical protein
MAQYVELTERTYDLGLVTFQTDDGAQTAFAQELSTRWRYETGDVYLVLGCRWAAAMGDERKVIAAVRTREGELDQWVDYIVEEYADDYGVEPMGSTVDQYFKDGRRTAAGWDGMP